VPGPVPSYVALFGLAGGSPPPPPPGPGSPPADARAVPGAALPGFFTPGDPGLPLTIPVPPAPVVPFFAAGSEPDLADFTRLIYDNFWFLSQRVVFRGRQAGAGQSMLIASPLKIDTIDEDPFNGWSGSPNWYWTAPYNGWYQITLTGFAATLSAGGALFLVVSGGAVGGGASYGVAQQNVQTAHGQGSSGTFWLYLLGGQDVVQASVQYDGSAGAPMTSVTAGQQSGMEICWAAL